MRPFWLVWFWLVRFQPQALAYFYMLFFAYLEKLI
nr:MAG TPA: hypothetical protein [Bacteriophage sp.]DAW77677.1 MAG TPA: hypothetical protein [Bacteriophage sp.]